MSGKRYCISKFYRVREQYQEWDDTSLNDEWQLEVYLHALGLMKKFKLKSIIDIGCGSAYKLLTYLGDYETTGTETFQTYHWLTEKYPDRNWLISDFSVENSLSTDLVICSDVMEHLVDPDNLITFIKNINFRYAIISTTCRNIIYRPLRDFGRFNWRSGIFGPPLNPSHIREWSFNEFHKYISIHFDVIDHRISNLAQATQMVICRPK